MIDPGEPKQFDVLYQPNLGVYIIYLGQEWFEVSDIYLAAKVAKEVIGELETGES